MYNSGAPFTLLFRQFDQGLHAVRNLIQNRSVLFLGIHGLIGMGSHLFGNCGDGFDRAYDLLIGNL